MKHSLPLTLSIGAALAALAALAAVPARPAVPPSAHASAPAAADPRTPDEESREHELRGHQLERARSLGWARDPFFPIPVPVVDEPDFTPTPEPLPGLPRAKLTGISLMNGAYLAIVDRHIVHEGDVLPSGYVVTRIARTAITLRLGDSEVTLALGDEK